MMRFPYLTITAVLLLVGCSGPDPVDKNASNTVGPPELNNETSTATGAPPANAAESDSGVAQPAAAAKIPAALQGRWGLTPMDCTSTRGDAKGLLVISGDRLRFYESTAAPSGNIATSPDSISGDFDYTGEGQSWTRFESLQVQGRKLVRTERAPNASFTYAKCD